MRLGVGFDFQGGGVGTSVVTRVSRHSGSNMFLLLSSR